MHAIKQAFQTLIMHAVAMLQWKGLPYGECTFETPQVIAQAGGQEALDQYEVTPAPYAELCYACMAKKP